MLTPRKALTTKSSESEQRSLFSIATNLNSKFMSTPGRVATVVDNSQISSMINIPNNASISSTNTPPPNAVDSGGDVTSGNEDDNTQPILIRIMVLIKLRQRWLQRQLSFSQIDVSMEVNHHVRIIDFLVFLILRLPLMVQEFVGMKIFNSVLITLVAQTQSSMMAYRKRLRRWERRLCSKYSMTDIRMLMLVLYHQETIF